MTSEEKKQMVNDPPISLLIKFTKFLLTVQPDLTLSNLIENNTLFSFLITTPITKDFMKKEATVKKKRRRGLIHQTMSRRELEKKKREIEEKIKKADQSDSTALGPIEEKVSLEEQIYKKIQQSGSNSISQQPSMKLLSLLLSKNQPFFNFSLNMKQIFFKYLRDKGFFRLFMGKIIGNDEDGKVESLDIVNEAVKRVFEEGHKENMNNKYLLKYARKFNEMDWFTGEGNKRVKKDIGGIEKSRIVGGVDIAKMAYDFELGWSYAGLEMYYKIVRDDQDIGRKAYGMDLFDIDMIGDVLEAQKKKQLEKKKELKRMRTEESKMKKSKDRVSLTPRNLGSKNLYLGDKNLFQRKNSEIISSRRKSHFYEQSIIHEVERSQASQKNSSRCPTLKQMNDFSEDSHTNLTESSLDSSKRSSMLAIDMKQRENKKRAIHSRKSRIVEKETLSKLSSTVNPQIKKLHISQNFKKSEKEKFYDPDSDDKLLNQTAKIADGMSKLQDKDHMYLALPSTKELCETFFDLYIAGQTRKNKSPIKKNPYDMEERHFSRTGNMSKNFPSFNAIQSKILPERSEKKRSKKNIRKDEKKEDLDLEVKIQNFNFSLRKIFVCCWTL
jgi:hypothetical protein